MKTNHSPNLSVAHAARAVNDAETVLATVDVAASPERVFRALNTHENYFPNYRLDFINSKLQKIKSS